MTVHVKTRVLPGKRIEVSNEGLSEGQDVEVTITPLSKPADSKSRGLVELIDSFPPGPRSAPTWEEIERQFREERDSWD
jgi:hypothetical protein